VFVDTAYGRVSQVLPPTPAGVDEPVYDPAVHASTFFDDFASYTNTDALKTAYRGGGRDYAELRGTVNLDVTSGVGDSKSFRVDWVTGCQGEGWTWLGAFDLAAPSVRTDTYYSFTLKVNTGYQFLGCGNGSKIVIFDQGLNDRHVLSLEGNGEQPLTYCTSDPWCHGATWGVIIDRPSASIPVYGWSQYKAHQNDAYRSQSYMNDGQWHRVTVHYLPESASLAGDGVIQVWIDGVLVQNHQGGDPASPAYGKVYTGIYTDHAKYRTIQFPTTINGGASSTTRSIWYDNVRVFYRK